ncbi:hypothetical protein [Teichococcus aestuarii]|uniref:hypothetical protein n=1 Tax=Teichococcus aestuarii TaxID=568898 RepID=UPI003619FA2F
MGPITGAALGDAVDQPLGRHLEALLGLGELRPDLRAALGDDAKALGILLPATQPLGAFLEEGQHGLWQAQRAHHPRLQAGIGDAGNAVRHLGQHIGRAAGLTDGITHADAEQAKVLQRRGVAAAHRVGEGIAQALQALGHRLGRDAGQPTRILQRGEAGDGCHHPVGGGAHLGGEGRPAARRADDAGDAGGAGDSGEGRDDLRHGMRHAPRRAGEAV